MQDDTLHDDGAPGWDAIENVLRPIYGDQEPVHMAPILSGMLGGDDPLQGISAYRATHGGTPHWHFVTFGYSELFEKESDDAAVSGFGFEMTIRVADPEHLDEPPPWVFSLLQNLARYVFSSGNVFEPGHHLTLNGPIALGRDTRLVAAAFVSDPELPETLSTPHGTLQFVQLVGISQDEYDAMRAWDTTKLLALFRETNPSLVTELTRTSYLDDAETRRRADEGAHTDGSSLGIVFNTKGGFETTPDGFVLSIAANALDDLQRFVLRRLELDRPTSLRAPGGLVMLEGGDTTEVLENQEGFAHLQLDATDRDALAALPVKRGDYPLPSGRGVVRVVPVEIWNGARTQVERVIG